MTCLMNGHQRRTACGVDGDRGTLQTQSVADPAGPGGTGGADGQVGLDLGVVQGLGGHAEVVMGRQPDEHPGPGVGQGGRRRAGVLHRPPRRLQQQPVLGIHPLGLPGRHAEERGVEPGGVVDESGPPGDDLARRRRVRIEKLVGVPPVRGNLRHRVPAVVQHIPELFGIGRPGQPRRVADDGEAGRVFTHVRWFPSGRVLPYRALWAWSSIRARPPIPSDTISARSTSADGSGRLELPRASIA